MSTSVRSSHWSCLPCYFQLLLDVGVQNCSSPSVSLSPSIAKTLLSLFATVISPSRRLLRNAVSLQLWNGSYAVGMPLVLFFSCLSVIWPLVLCTSYPPEPGRGVSVANSCSRRSVPEFRLVNYWNLARYSKHNSQELFILNSC